MKIIIIIFFLVLLLLVKFFKIKKHRFWDKQPVSRNNLKNEGKIVMHNPKFNLNLENLYKIRNLKINGSSIDIFNFINKNFNDNYQYTHNFLNKSLTYIKNSKVENLAMYKNNEIIGFIHAKPLKISIKNSNMNILYVDYLCVKKNYRNKNLASFLISSLINNNINEIFIFKKEEKSLPFNYINYTNYYYLDISNLNNFDNIENKFSLLTEKNILDVYNFIVNIKQEKKLYQILSFLEFKELYFNNESKVIIEYNDNNIKAVLIYNLINFKDNDKILKTADIEYIFTKGIGKFNIMEFMIKECKDKNVNVISLVDQLNNNYFIDRYNFIKSMKLYFHMYNYHINNIINSYDMCFNIL